MIPFLQKLAPDKSNSRYAQLLKDAMQQVIRLSGKVWTDHNEHDPGITILEALCYAITEQQYFTDLPVEEQLQILRKDNIATDFFSPEKVLFNAPVTLLDWRKWLIDKESILNAWITPRKIYAPSFFLQNNSYNYTAGTLVDLRGIYNILVQWDRDKILGELNGNILSLSRTVNLLNGSSATYWADLIFPFVWDTTDSDFIAFRNAMAFNSITIAGGNLEPDAASQGVFFADLDITYNGIQHLVLSVILRVNTPMSTDDEKAAVQAVYEAYLTDLNGPVILYNKIIQQCNVLAAQTRELLMANRNLAEDFAELSAVNILEIGVQCDIELTPGVDVVPILAEIFFVLDGFISPVILPETPAEDELYKSWEGPGLLHGYLSDTQLQMPPGRSIFLSDILHVMLEGRQHQRNPDIIAIFNLSLQSYINNKLASESAENCLQLPDDFTWRPRLNIFKSSVNIRQRGVTRTYSITEVYNAYQALKNTVVTSPVISLLPPITPIEDIAPVQAYYPVQYEMPACYELRLDERTPANAQARGYFFFFEQVLANFKSQWEHSMQLLSVNNTATETRFPANLRQLLPFYDAYLDSNYETALAPATAENQARRSLLLDHLLARIGEDFRYYAAWNNLSPVAANSAKYNFLQAAPVLAPRRFQAADYTMPVFNTTNAPAILQKFVHLFQLPDNLVKRRWKNPAPLFSISGAPFNIAYTVYDAGSNPAMVSRNYAFTYEAEDGTTDFFLFGVKKDNYRIIENAGLFSFVLMDDQQHILASSINTYATAALATTAAYNLAGYIISNWLPEEGMHFVEPILLRPRSYTNPALKDDFLEIPLQPDMSVAEGFGTDLYSSHLLVVLPGAGSRFGDPGYREVASAVIRKELPAWLQVRVLWLNIFLMYEFENAWETYTIALSTPATPEVNFNTAKNDLVAVINKIFVWLQNRGEY